MIDVSNYASEPVVVRKYGNRRLYRTDESRYVTLDELATLVREGVDFVVHDAKTGADLSGVVLAQVVLEQEKRTAGGAFPVELLRQLIRMQEPALAEFVTSHVPRLADIYLEGQAAVSDTLDMAAAGNGAVGDGEVAIISQLASVQVQLSQLLDALEVEEID